MKVKISFLLLCVSLATTACGDGSTEKKDTDTMDTEDAGSGDTEDAGPGDTEDTDTGDTEEPVVVYTVTVDGDPVPVERISKFEVPVNYVHLTYAGSDLDFEIKADEPFTEYTLSPKIQGIEGTVSGDTLSFTATEPAYLVLQIPDQERLFILIDPEETDAPQLGDDDVKDIMDYGSVDNTGGSDMTAVIQAAIDEASGAQQNILYFPEGIYAVKYLFLKDNMTLYLAEGAVLQTIITPGALLSQPEDLTLIEGCSRGFIMMDGVSNAKLKGRGTIDGDGAALQESGKKMFLVKIQNSTDCEVEGIISRDSCFWNTLVYRSDNISISNYKVINNRLNGEWNETDGVDFDNCTNSTLKNAFLYTGDDCMAVKSDDIPDDDPIEGIGDPTTDDNYMSVDNLSHEKIVCFSGSAGCKVGTKTLGETMSNVLFKDVDVVTTDRALVIDAVDTANVIGTVFEDIRIEEATGRLVDFNMDPESIFWRTKVGICTVTDTVVTNVSADVNAECRISGNIHDWDTDDPYYGNEYFINGVAFTNFSIDGHVITSIDDPNALFNVNEYTSDITFSN